MTSTQIFILGILGLIGTLATSYVLIRKLGPELNKMTVDTSASLVAMAKENAEQHRLDAADLRARNKDLDDRLTRYVAANSEMHGKLEVALERLASLEQAAADAESIRQEAVRYRAERNLARKEAENALSENAALRVEIDGLRHEVTELRHEVAQLRSSGTIEG